MPLASDQDGQPTTGLTRPPEAVNPPHSTRVGDSSTIATHNGCGNNTCLEEPLVRTHDIESCQNPMTLGNQEADSNTARSVIAISETNIRGPGPGNSSAQLDDHQDVAENTSEHRQLASDDKPIELEVGHLPYVISLATERQGPGPDVPGLEMLDGVSPQEPYVPFGTSPPRSAIIMSNL
jgi:hypothetical protein